MLGKQERLAELNNRHNALLQIIERRALAQADDPIGASGLYNRTYRIKGSRQYPVLVEEYSLDHQLLRELREIEKQFAIESGEWITAPQPVNRKAEQQANFDVMVKRLNAGRDRVVAWNAQREAERQQEAEAIAPSALEGRTP